MPLTPETAAGHGKGIATGRARWLFPVEDSDGFYRGKHTRFVCFWHRWRCGEITLNKKKIYTFGESTVCWWCWIEFFQAGIIGHAKILCFFTCQFPSSSRLQMPQKSSSALRRSIKLHKTTWLILVYVGDMMYAKVWQGTSPKNWHRKSLVFIRKYIFKRLLFHCHVSFGCCMFYASGCTGLNCLVT